MVDRGEFAEWARVHGHLYGTPARTLEAVLDRGEDVLLDIDTQGARQLRARYPRGGSTIFVVAPSIAVSSRPDCKRTQIRTRPGEIARRLDAGRAMRSPRGASTTT